MTSFNKEQIAGSEIYKKRERDTVDCESHSISTDKPNRMNAKITDTQFMIYNMLQSLGK